MQHLPLQLYFYYLTTPQRHTHKALVTIIQEILEAVRRQGAPNARYWEARFRQALGQGDVEGAAKVLYEAARKAGPQRRQSYRERWELFQLDRALVAARAGSSGEARRLLRGIEVDGPRRGRVLLVRGLCDLADGKTDAVSGASITVKGFLDLCAQALKAAK